MWKRAGGASSAFFPRVWRKVGCWLWLSKVPSELLRYPLWDLSNCSKFSRYVSTLSNRKRYDIKYTLIIKMLFWIEFRHKAVTGTIYIRIQIIAIDSYSYTALFLEIFFFWKLKKSCRINNIIIQKEQRCFVQQHEFGIKCLSYLSLSCLVILSWLNSALKF